MSSESSPTAAEMKKYLHDAGALEENMSYEELLSCYKVIKCSENTAQQEEKRRSFTENDKVNGSKPKPLDMLVDFTLEDDIEDDDNESPISKSSIRKQTTPKSSKSKFSLKKQENSLKPESNLISKLEKHVEYDVYDSPPLKHKPLDIILYERKYDLPPYCNPKFSKLTILQRAKLIHNFHRVILERFYKLHCESLNPITPGRPISSSDKFNGSLDRKSQLVDDNSEYTQCNEEDTAEPQEIYTSRSGRQTKRKLYSDAMEDDEFKKSKKEDDKPFEIEKKSVIKRQNTSKLSNQDIMKRSKLFSEPAKSNTRSDKLFDLLKHSEKKTNLNPEQKAPNDVLNSSIDDCDDLIPNSQDDDIVELKPLESTFIPRRVPPPSLRRRRPIGGKRQPAADTSKSNGSSQSSSAGSTKISAPSSTAVTSNEQNNKSVGGKTKCPICSELFFHEEIEAHASSCGLLMETESNFDVLLNTSGVKKVTCSVCDREMIMNGDYEIHVRNCIAKAKECDSL